MTYTQYYRMWLPDSVEPDGGIWCYMGMDKEGYLHQLNWLYDDNDAEQLDTLEQYLQWGYKIEQLCY